MDKINAESIPFEARTYEDHVRRHKEVVERLDELYAEIEEKNGRFPFPEFVIALDRELIEELGRTAYEIHRGAK